MNYQIRVIDKFSKNDIALYKNIAKLISPISETYPKYNEWLFTKFFPELKTQKRKIIVAYTKKNTPIGVALLKDYNEEKKICSLFVKEDCRGKGIASNLIKKSCEVLNTNKPLLTVSDKNLPMLQKLLDKNGFKFSYKRSGVYQKEDTENYFNNEATEILKKNILTPLLLRIKNNSQKE